MITQKDIAEIKNLHKEERCPYTHVAACYVVDNAISCIVPPKSMLELQNEEFFKYLDIAKNIFQTKSIGEKNLELKASYEGLEIVDDWKNIALGQVMDEEALDAVYESIVANISSAENYTILLYFGVYDIMVRTEDGNDLDESEEVYKFVTCAICPTTLEKPSLEMQETKIEPLDRKWIIGKPKHGFCYPAFENRSADTTKALYYCSNPEYPLHALMENVLGMERELTGTEYRADLKGTIMGIVKSEEEVQQYQEELAVRLESIARDAEVEQKDTRITPDMLESLLKPITEHAAAVAKEYGKDCMGNIRKQSSCTQKSREMPIMPENRSRKAKNF